jgi:hypothetical protein
MAIICISKMVVDSCLPFVCTSMKHSSSDCRVLQSCLPLRNIDISFFWEGTTCGSDPIFFSGSDISWITKLPALLSIVTRNGSVAPALD